MPDIPDENYWFRRHEAAYEFALRHVRGHVLEVGCGEGYGTALLASAATSILGVDYDRATVQHAARQYPQARFVRGNLAALPVGDAAVDVLATLQVIEHVWDHPQFVRECRRVLRPDGLLLVTTPNRLTFSPGRETPLNPFHTKEFTSIELVELIRHGGFRSTWIGGLHAGKGLAEADERHGGSLVDAQLATSPHEWSAALRADVAAITTRDFIVAADTGRDVDESLDLVVLAERA
ncbi:class I SAM-dependent methyltransferase [uncultured Jatrophihabitans sp.]|uniref:class I SAM-dependent methyltransferase n=1 Tax=uncultured Jatrophihabitans sp. TaxID=1610747 RepID=UPI0035CB7BC8